MLMPTARVRAPRTRKEPTRSELARRGLVAVLVLTLVGLAYLSRGAVLGGPPHLAADLRNAGGSLRAGSDVKVHGVIVGQVTGISRYEESGGVRVRMAMDETLIDSVPADVVARILPATVFGTSFVDLRPQTAAAAGVEVASIEVGTVIPADSSQRTLELQQALDDIDRLVKALGPADLATAIGAAAVALQGRGEQIGATAEKLDSYLARLTPKLATVRTDLAKLAQFLSVVQEVAPDLLQATDDGLAALRSLVEHQDDLQAILVNATTLAQASDAFLKQNRRELVRFIENGYRLLDALYDNRVAGISGAIAANARIGSVIEAAVKQGYIEVDGRLALNVPGEYGAGDRPTYGAGR